MRKMILSMLAMYAWRWLTAKPARPHSNSNRRGAGRPREAADADTRRTRRRRAAG